MKITNSFLIVSNFNNDIRWVSEYTDNYVIYNKTGEIPSNIDPQKVIPQTKYGQSMYDYLCYIVDNYDSLPPLVQFVKGNIFPRIMSQEDYDMVCNNNFFTPLENYGKHKVKYPNSFMSCDGGYEEYNDSWYLNELPHRYFHSYNSFLEFIYKEPILPIFIRFAPGGCYIVSREQIRKIPKIVYEKLKGYLIYTHNPAEAHMMERSIYTWWNSNMEINMLHLKENYTERNNMNTSLRKATIDDARFLLESHNMCRDGFFNSNKISMDEHLIWLNQQLNNKDTCVFVCEVEDKPCGSVRWKKVNDVIDLHWEILPEYRGMGLSKIFVKKLIELLPGKKLHAEIKTENFASVNTALSVGFIKKTSIDWELDPR